MPDFLRLRYRAQARREMLGRADRLPRGWGLALDGIAAIYKEQLQAETPEGAGAPGHEPGTLRKDWTIRPSGRGLRASRRIFNPHRYLKWVLEGRPAIDHRPPPESAAERKARRKRGEKRVFPQKRLHFWIGNREFYRWYVRAQAPNNFIPRARERARREARRRFPEFAGRVMGRLAIRW